MKVLAIVQARLGSSRLPGKVLRPVLGQPLLYYQMERLERCENIDEIVVATTKEEKDDPLACYCEEQGWNLFRGDENDVLDRFVKTADQYGGDVIVRLTADCPLIDPLIIDHVIDLYLSEPGEKIYVSNVIERTFPRGMDVEVFSRDALKEMATQAKSLEEREHVTLYMRDPENGFEFRSVTNEDDLSMLRLTVDEEDDFVLVSQIIEHLYPDDPEFGLMEILELLSDHPDWIEINRHVEQKKV